VNLTTTRKLLKWLTAAVKHALFVEIQRAGQRHRLHAEPHAHPRIAESFAQTKEASNVLLYAELPERLPDGHG
jgi:hypothetical protein